MNAITINDLQRLLEHTGRPGISIYIPTHRTGVEVLEKKDQLVFRDAVKEAKSQAEALGLPEAVTKRLEEYAASLLDDGDFWRQLLDTLVVFVSEQLTEYFVIPSGMERKVEVSSEFYTLPLLPLFADKRHFLLLLLSKKTVRLYDVTPTAQQEVNTEGLLPSNFEEVVGSDYEAKNLQYHTANPQQSSATFHGHGVAKDKSTDEIQQYFRAIDKGITKLVPDGDVPLVLACIEEYFGEYRKVNRYRSLSTEYIKGNPDKTEINLLREKGWKALKFLRSELIQKNTSRYQELNQRGLTSSMSTEIIPASVNGRVDTLFVQKGMSAYGSADSQTANIVDSQERNENDIELLNHAAAQTFMKKGIVLIVDSDDMPQAESSLNAIYRY